MIKSFKSKGLDELWNDDQTGKIDRRLHARISRRLQFLNEVALVEEMNVVGFNFHALNGFDPTRYTVHVNGPWCITFEFEHGDATNVDFEQYH